MLCLVSFAQGGSKGLGTDMMGGKLSKPPGGRGTGVNVPMGGVGIGVGAGPVPIGAGLSTGLLGTPGGGGTIGAPDSGNTPVP